MNAHRLEVGGHPPANAPYLLHFGIAQHPIALERIGNVDHPARLRLQALGRVIGQLGERLCAGDADTHGDPSALEDPGAQGSPELRQVFLNARQIGEAFINAVDLGVRHHRFDQGHDALAHVAVQRVITTEGHDAVAAQLVLCLKIRLAHLHVGLRIVRPGDHAAVIVAQHDNRGLGQVRPEYPLAARIERVAIDQRKYRVTAHGRERCNARRPR
ncbi:hypothetical protein D3C76_882020 [compost metagenome]